MAIRRTWAKAQLLDGRWRSAADIASHLVGLQAQDMSAVGHSLRARGATDSVDSLVLTWSLRGTRHLHHRHDVGWIVDLVGPVFSRPGTRAKQLGIEGRVGTRAVDALSEALSAGPLDRRQVKDLLAPLGVDPKGQAAIHVIARAALERRLVVVPSRPGRSGHAGQAERYAPFPEYGTPAPGDPGAELARRYLIANGPARPADFAAWSGLGAPLARDAFAAIAGELVEVDTPLGPMWSLASHRPRRSGPSPLRLLGAFDSLLLGHADRSLILPPEHARRVNPGGGMIKPVVVSDGEVIGTWSARTGVDPFRPFLPAERAAVTRALLAFRR